MAGRVPIEAERTPPSPLRRSAGAHWETWGAARGGARVVISGMQATGLVVLVTATVVVMEVSLRLGLIGCLAVVTVMYFVTGVHKIVLLARGETALARVPRRDRAPQPMMSPASVPDEGLPFYSVLVPLYREGRILPTLVERLSRLDYPAGRLEVLLLIEADDEETRLAARRFRFPAHMRPVLMPPGQPRTKPRALNIGLHKASGELVVVYDAEDQPDPDQLRKAAEAMRKLPPDVVCLQARLNFYNARQSYLTRLGAIDYAVWYKQYLPGLSAGRRRRTAFVPLGGTSNHFRTALLKRLGGWDPWNVTEDCDLGVRLGREQLRVAMLDSTTWEEAVPRARPWVRQRSRWVKGYLQTYLVHMRKPLRLARELGLRGFIDFQLLVGFSSLLLLVNPFMWALTGLYVATKGTPAGGFIQSLYPAPLYYLALFSLLLWNFIFFYCNVYVCVRHNMLRLTRSALLAPLYWLLMSVAAWAALISLIWHPFYWAKTVHGVSRPPSAARVAARQPEPLAQGAPR